MTCPVLNTIEKKYLGSNDLPSGISFQYLEGHLLNCLKEIDENLELMQQIREMVITDLITIRMAVKGSWQSP